MRRHQRNRACVCPASVCARFQVRSMHPGRRQSRSTGRTWRLAFQAFVAAYVIYEDGPSHGYQARPVRHRRSATAEPIRQLERNRFLSEPVIRRAVSRCHPPDFNEVIWDGRKVGLVQSDVMAAVQACRGRMSRPLRASGPIRNGHSRRAQVAAASVAGLLRPAFPSAAAVARLVPAASVSR